MFIYSIVIFFTIFDTGQYMNLIHLNTDGITAVELAKLVNLPVDTVKKKLNILKDKNIVIVKGINPKCWKFDEYNFHRLDDDDEIFHLLCNFDDVDFDKYFTY